MKKRFLAVVLAMVMCLAMAAPAFAADGDFTMWGDVLGKYNGNGGAVAIPDGVTSIGDYAFYGCTGLTSVTIPNSVTSIGNSAFVNCTGLTSVTIPNSVTSIGDYVFSGCAGLTAIQVDAGNQSYASVDGAVFTAAKDKLVVYPVGKQGAYTIPDGVTSIGDYAFNVCTGLTSVTIPNSVTSIGNNAFDNCTSLTSVTIPDGVTSIGDHAFGVCTSLTSVTIPNSVTSIGGSAFSGCIGLTAIQVDAGNQSYASVDGVVFTAAKDKLVAYPAGKQGAYTIPDGVTNIGRGAFSGCTTSLTSVTIPDGVTSIGSFAFYACTSLTSVTIPNSVTSIGDGAFYVCNSLKDVYYTGTEAQWKAIQISDLNNGNNCLLKATIHYNSTGPDQPQKPDEPQQPTLPEVEPIAPTGTAVPTTQTVKLDGKDVQVQYYAIKDAKGNATNYVKIRDLADALNGTKAQFNLSWDNGKIGIIPNTAYQPNGSENNTPYSGSQTYKAVSDTPVNFNGKEVNLTSFQIIYQSGGYTYYKLRDLGQLLNFETRWDSAAGRIVIETDKPYTGN